MTLLPDELIVDNFAGGGGASSGIELALGRSPDIAINHDREALAMHAANHPATQHYCESVWDIDPRKVCGNRPVGLAWFSPDCTFHSKARGGKPFRDRNKARRRRGLAWVVVRWAEAVHPRVIALENVEEFAHWGPLGDDGKPCPDRKGFTFRRWKARLENLGYQVECRELRASHYGTPTIRKRLFVIARCDGAPIVWPAPTHGQGVLPYRTAADIIDWSIPCPSIFERKRPLAEATLRRIARGVFKYVIDAAEPFIVPIAHYNGRDTVQPISEPLRTVTAHPKGGSLAVVSPTLIQTGYGERPGQAPRVPGLDKPIGTLVGTNKHALVAAFLAQHNGGFYDERGGAGNRADAPLSTITHRGTQQQVVASHLVKLKGTSKHGQQMTLPLHTVAAGGQHFGEVRSFLTRYNGASIGQDLRLPVSTVDTTDRLGLVIVHGEPYQIVDIGMRMLTPRELFRAQGFRDSYVIAPVHEGKPLTKTAQVRMCGNSVCPPLAAAIIAAQFREQERRVAA